MSTLDSVLYEVWELKQAVQTLVVVVNPIGALHEEKHMTGSGALERPCDPERILHLIPQATYTFAELQLDRTKQSPSSEPITF